MSSSPDNSHDLDVLQRRTPPAAPKRAWAGKLTTTVLVLGLLGVAYAVLRPLLDPPARVRVVAPKPGEALDGAVQGRRVEAQGWLEADPFPITVRPLVRGVVEELRVVESQAVSKGTTVLAVLRSLDIENERILAAAEIVVRKAAVTEARELATIATTLLDQRLAPRREVADLEGARARAEAAIVGSQRSHDAALAAVQAAEVDVAAQERLRIGGTSTPVALEQAQVAVRVAEARAAERVQTIAEHRADLQRIDGLLVVAREGRDDPRALQAAVDRAVAAVPLAEAAHARAEARVAVAERNYEHLTVYAPIDGVVLRLESAPGALVGPQGEFKGSAEAGSSGGLNRLTGTLCVLYDPQRIQARIDVPLGDVAGIASGTKTELEVATVAGQRFAGVVDRLVHEADINKNTLQVKVRIPDPQGLLRPEMLCRASFVIEGTAPTGKPRADQTASASWWVPSPAVRDGAVFVLDPAGGGRARRLAVDVVATADGQSRVRGALGRSSKVIVDPVEDGARVEVQP